MPTPSVPLSTSELELARRTLVSEQRRASILALVIGVLVVISAIHTFTLGRNHDLAMPVYQLVTTIMGIAALYEFGISRLFAWMIKRDRLPPRYRLYINAFIEIALPTLTAWVAAKYIPPARAITGLATYPYFLLILLSVLRLDFSLAVFTGAVACAGFTLLSVAHWKELDSAWGGAQSGIHFSFFLRGLMYLIFGLVAGIVSRGIRRNLMETLATMQERERIMYRFGQHLSPSVVNLLLTQPPQPELRDICIMVLDIRNFTSYSESRPAEEVVGFLNTLWTFMVRTVNENHGNVNKFLGDGFLATFGAPVSSGIDCKNALAASHAILAELEKLTTSGKLPPTSVGIALHSGQVIVGEFGTEEKKEYTVIGDVVNVAFRIEALNKEFGSKLLVSQPVYDAAAIEHAEPMEPISIRGRKEPVQLYKIA